MIPKRWLTTRTFCARCKAQCTDHSAGSGASAAKRTQAKGPEPSLWREAAVQTTLNLDDNNKYYSGAEHDPKLRTKIVPPRHSPEEALSAEQLDEQSRSF